MKAKVFQLHLGMIQLSPLTPGGCWHGPASVTAGKVTHPFPHSTALQTTHCIALQSLSIHRKPPPPVGAMGCHPHLHPTAGITGTSNPSHPQAASPRQGHQICHCLSPQLIRLLWFGDSPQEGGGSCSHVLVLVPSSWGQSQRTCMSPAALEVPCTLTPCLHLLQVVHTHCPE